MILSQMKQENYDLLCYTRRPMEENIYSAKLAYSMHLAYSEDGIRFNELNHNSGVLFAKSTENTDGTLNAKSLKNPYLFQMAEGGYGVLAVRTEPEGDNDAESKGCVLLFTTSDLLRFKEVGLIHLDENTYVNDVKCIYDTVQKKYVIHWSDIDNNYFTSCISDITSLSIISTKEEAEAFCLTAVCSDIEGIVPRNAIQISKEMTHRLICKLTAPMNVKIEVPSKVSASFECDVKAVRAIATYSDGTTSLKNIEWDVTGVNWNQPGTYRIEGKVHQDHYSFPIAINRADPCIGKWNGKYYFIATNDADNNHSHYIREADNIPDLINAKEVKILDTTMYEHLGDLLWAPEFHIIGDDLYIFHSGTPGEFVKEQSHVMKLKKGGDPVNAHDWNMPVRVVKKDGSYLYDEAGITLDMTCFEHNDNVYIIWAQRQFFPVDQGSWLYIAKVDKKEPWKLITDPVLISKPEYGWANNHVFVDEGPYPLITNKKIFVSFASALIDATYVVGLLSAEKDADLLDVCSWTKENYPILTSRSVPGEYGPGHNAYVVDDDGIVWNTYHARPGIDAPRSSGIRRVHFDIEGYPVLDLTEERDLNKDLEKVSTTVIVS